MCSMDAVYRVYQYQTYPASLPGVRIIKVRLPQFVEFQQINNCLCDMGIYFLRSQELSHLRFTEFFNIYSWGYKLPSRFRDVRESVNTFHAVHAQNINKTIYIFRKRDVTSSITRMEMLYPTAGKL